jgi:alpha-amylase
MSGHFTGRGGDLSRRDVIKGIGAAGAAALGSSALTGGASALGDSAVYQYYHTPWTEIEADLATLADQGYDAIQVPPAQRSRVYEYEREYSNGKYNPPLGYQPIDLQDFDSEFGTESEYQSMIDEAHNQGLEVIADAVVNHMAAGGDYFDRKVTVEDLPQFQSEDFHPECSIDYSSDYSVEGCWLVGLRDLAQEQADVRSELKAYVDKYKSFGVDGIRWDAAKHIPESFFNDYANQWASDLYTVGEVIPEAYDGTSKLDYLDQYVNTGMSVTDYPLHKKMIGVFSYGDMSALSGYGYVNRNPLGALTFVANHDSGDDATPSQLLLAYAYILTYEGYPRVYSDDIGVSDDAIRNLLWIKNNLIDGSAAYDRITDSDVYAFERYNDALVAINNSTSWQTRYPYTSWRSTSLNDYTGSNDSFADGNGYAEVNVPPEGYVVLAP